MVDSPDEGLLLFEMKRSRKPPDEEHPLVRSAMPTTSTSGAFVAAILIFGFGLGSGVTSYEGP